MNEPEPDRSRPVWWWDFGEESAAVAVVMDGFKVRERLKKKEPVVDGFDLPENSTLFSNSAIGENKRS